MGTCHVQPAHEMSEPSRPLKHAEMQRRRFISDLQAFLRFPSISAQPALAAAVRQCADWLASHVRSIGLEHVQVIDTPRHPIVYADWAHAARRPTVLIYGHYDVQPVDPLKEWQAQPFEPAIRDGWIFGRGASDDKGQLFTHVKAIESCLRATQRLPVNVKCIFEGEEEIGSPNLHAFLAQNKTMLASDVAVISDTAMLSARQPSITYSLRGNLSLEIEVTGPPRDLHSGNFGGAIHNPLQVLCELIATLHHRDGRVAVPGFYDEVVISEQRLPDGKAQQPIGDETILRNAGVRCGWGERGYTLYERTTSRPALTINGISGGYQGPGGKGIIPARTTAKLSVRLVPRQDPARIDKLLRSFIHEQASRIAPCTVQIRTCSASHARPSVTSTRHPAMRAAAIAYQRGFGAKPVFMRSGGTIPVVNMLQQLLGISTVLMGYGLPEDNIHGPNERFDLQRFMWGISTNIHFLYEAARIVPITR
jgi:acetylornithine deacetylase/succinyl-diaminopimelate desuccinylase-like protein